MSDSADRSHGEWITQRQASRQLGCSPTAVQRLGLLQKIRTRLDPGVPVRYHAEDVRRIAEARSQMAGA
jgi:hypothetical protein